MGRANEILVGRYNRFLQKFLSMKGPPPAPQLASEIAATWALFHGAENRYLEGWDRFGFAQGVAAVAAQEAGLRIRNPGASNVIAVFEKIKVTFVSASADNVVISSGAQAADFGTILPGTNIRFDPRGRPQSTLIISTTNAVAIADMQARDGILGTTNTQFDSIITDIQEITLLPGDALQARNTTLNQSLNIVLWWRERFLEDSERT